MSDLPMSDLQMVAARGWFDRRTAAAVADPTDSRLDDGSKLKGVSG